MIKVYKIVVLYTVAKSFFRIRTQTASQVTKVKMMNPYTYYLMIYGKIIFGNFKFVFKIWIFKDAL